MKRLILISAVCMQFGWISGVPHPSGVGAYAYQDSNGNRYGGTYGLKDDQINLGNQDNLEHFNPVPFQPDFDDFFPEYFRNFENLLQEVFNSNREYQRKALETAKKAYDITSNQASFMNADFSRFAPFGGMPGFGNFAAFGNNDNSAFASGVAAPGYTHQTAAISPGNPNTPNVDVTQRFSDGPGAGNYMSVSSSSYSASTNNNGMPSSHRVAETLVNNNGKVTHYKVEN
ncbi:hypothetical protein MSG28_010804 [Choristoneura fumiferana]|uniref:Uncharacterized protein n=1 Tax=Choristoneura fumiferana TaxID=7141 RepID=A0ACC0KNT3_CHOFU|nr:hypothetical protein MSG28_010804 [Choristoneura fumiferana]